MEYNKVKYKDLIYVNVHMFHFWPGGAVLPKIT